MIAAQNPPGFIVRTEAHKAASHNGYRLVRDVENGWLRFGSTTAKGDIWIAAASESGPWLLSIERSETVDELGSPSASVEGAPGKASYSFQTLEGLYRTLDHTYRLGLSLPDVPLGKFRFAIRNLPRTTEAERLVIQRIGQDLFRQALIEYWNGRCPITGITDPALLRASHIVPWSECESDEQRLDVHNGLLLSALWDAAFDAGLVSFADDGGVLISPELGAEAKQQFGASAHRTIQGLTSLHQSNLQWHRTRYSPVGGWISFGTR
jgi:hypothetical protein